MHACAGIMDMCYRYLLMFSFALFGCICATSNKYGTISVEGPAFLNRVVTIKATPSYPWECDLEWRYVVDGGTQSQTIIDETFTTYSEDGSFFLKGMASIKYNRSNFYAVCSKNTTIRTRFTSLYIKDIVGRCGVLVILNPVVRGTDVELGYFPSDLSIKRQIDNGRRVWKKNTHMIHLREDSYEERTVSEYLYILTIFNFDEKDEGTYMLSCNAYSNTDSVQLHISDMPSVLSMSVKKIHEYNNNVCVWFFNISCETNISNPPCTIEWSSDNDNLRYNQSNNWTLGKSQSYHSVSNVLYNVNTNMTGGTITCSTICDHFPFHLNTDYTVSSSDFSPEQFMKAEVVKESNHNVLNLTCKTVDTCMPCTIAWSSNSVFLSSISTAQWTNASNLGYTTVSNALYLITKGLDGKRIHCSTYCGNAYSHSEQETYIISLEDFQESTTNLASVLTQVRNSSVLYSVAGSILVVLVTMCTVLLFRRCKPHVYETVLLRRRSAVAGRPRHMYDGVQYNVETNALYNQTEVSARAINSQQTPPPLLNMNEQNVRLNRTVRQYDYVDTPVDHRDRHKKTPTANHV